MIRFRVKNWLLLLKALVLVAMVIAAKLASHFLGYELLSLNNLFSGIIAGNVFLMGFLLSGVLSDYKEAERIPGEMAAALATIFEECSALAAGNLSTARDAAGSIAALCERTLHWFHRKTKTRDLLILVQDCNMRLNKLEPSVPANHVVRLKNELTTIRRLVIRTDTIRDTSFISSGYLIASTVTGLLCIGLVLSKIEPFAESLFFVGVISFLMVFLLLLIRDLDDPFAFDEGESAENVSLYPLDRLLQQIATGESATGQNISPMFIGGAPIASTRLENEVAAGGLDQRHDIDNTERGTTTEDTLA